MSFPTIYQTWVFRLIWGLGGPNNQDNFFFEFHRYITNMKSNHNLTACCHGYTNEQDNKTIVKLNICLWNFGKL